MLPFQSVSKPLKSPRWPLASPRRAAPTWALILLALALPAQAEEPALPAPPKKLEGAIGLVFSYSPEYAGAARHSVGLVPAGFIRYGRISISGAGGFTTRRSDDVERGVAASLVEREHVRVSLAARFDNGRNDGDSDRLAGMGDIDATLRARLLVRWMPDAYWTLASSLSADVLGRGGGWWADVGLSRTWRLSPITKVQVGGRIGIAGDTYLQTWYGVTPEQAARSGHPVYTPAAGLHDASLGITLRTEFGPRWGTFVGAGVSRQLGPAAASPLVEAATGWSLSTGLVWRF